VRAALPFLVFLSACGAPESEPVPDVEPCAGWAAAREACDLPVVECQGERAQCDARCLMSADCSALAAPEQDLSVALCRLGCDTFECDEGMKLPSWWKCDGQIDCEDLRDEQDCEL
jgi:hypothetical protein